MSRPEPGSTVGVYWNGFKLFDLEDITVVDDPSLPGWMQIDGHSRKETRGGIISMPQSVLVTVREAGGVRVRDSGEWLEPTGMGTDRRPRS
jgi:hypothetical protein